jgi:hypothetical protein
VNLNGKSLTALCRGKAALPTAVCFLPTVFYGSASTMIRKRNVPVV